VRESGVQHVLLVGQNFANGTSPHKRFRFDAKTFSEARFKALGASCGFQHESHPSLRLGREPQRALANKLSCRRAACWISVDLTRAAEGEEAVAGGCLGDAWSFVEAGLADIPWTESVARGVPFASGIQAW
jgi:hypothetical protein